MFNQKDVLSWLQNIVVIPRDVSHVRNTTNTLNRMLHRALNEQAQDQDIVASSSDTNYRHLTSDDMCEWLKQVHQEVVHSRREIKKLRKCVEMLIEEWGTTVEDDLDDHLTQIMMTQSKEVESMFEEGTFG